MADGLHSVLGRSKMENRRGDGASEIIQETQGEMNAVLQIVGNKSTRKEFGGRLGRGERRELDRRGLFEKKNRRKRSTRRRGNAGITMPGSSVHPKLAVKLAKNNAIVAEKLHAGMRHPEARGGALTGARVAEEEVAAAVFVEQTQGVNFQAFAQGQAVHHDELVSGVFERVHLLTWGKTGAIENDVAARKSRIKPGSLVGSRTQCWRGEIKLRSRGVREGRPEPAGNKCRGSVRQIKMRGPRNVQFNFAGMRTGVGNGEGLVCKIKRDRHAAFTPHAEGEAADRQRQTGGATGGECGVCERRGHVSFSD